MEPDFWQIHVPTKHASLREKLTVTCGCGWRSSGKNYAMDDFRAHVTSLMPKHEEIKTTTLEKKVSANHSTKRRFK